MVNRKTLRSLEFLLVVLTNAAAWIASAADWLDPRYAAYATAASGAIYAISRGLAKMNADTRDYWRTTEFYVAILTSLGSVAAALADVIPAQTYAFLQGSIIAAVSVAMGLRKEPTVAAGRAEAAIVDAETAFVTDSFEGVEDGVDGAAVAPPKGGAKK